MPVTAYPAPHFANTINKNLTRQNALTVLHSAAEQHTDHVLKLLQSSMDNDVPAAFIKASNGLFNFYVNAHAEELRSSFVAHKGKKELVVTIGGPDYGFFAQQMGKLIQENVVDPTLREWIMPNFSTTTMNDTITASIAMMATLQAYFQYSCMIICGLPSVTLDGEKSDYEKILQKLDKLCEYGQETTDFANLLRPIVQRLIQTFDDPKDPTILDFWNRIYSYRSMGSGMSTATGWITAFCFWDSKGRRISQPSPEALELDGVRYHVISGGGVPSGYLSVPAKINDNGREFKAELFAGSVGMKCTSSEQQSTAAAAIDTVSPLTGWWVYEKLEGQDSPSERLRKREERLEQEWLEKMARREQERKNQERRRALRGKHWA
ncbi:hypothetical protein MBLNU457_1343t1 [Dothideomycetes sp. NU457]